MREKKRILCVDHEPRRLSILTFRMETWGYAVWAVGSAEEALDIVRLSVEGGIDLLMVELMLPGMAGDELVRRAKGIRPELPAMLMTPVPMTARAEWCAEAFLPERTPPAEMLARIRTLVARRRGPKKRELQEAVLCPTG